MEMMRLALLQVQVPADPAGIREFLAGVAPGRPGTPFCLACLPELFHTNYSSLRLRDAELAPAPVAEILDCTRDNPNLVLAGSMASERQGRRSNCLTIFHRDRALPLYDKLHLFGPMNESSFFSPGDHWGVLEIQGDAELWRVGFAICYDLRFPEVFRLLAAAGCDLVVVVAQWPSARVKIWRALLQVRAAENQFFLAGVNRCGYDDNEEFGGSSMILAPDGSILAEATDQPQLLQAELSRDEINRSRRLFYSYRDRLEGAYQLTSGLAVNRMTIRLPHKSK